MNCVIFINFIYGLFHFVGEIPIVPAKIGFLALFFVHNLFTAVRNLFIN